MMEVFIFINPILLMKKLRQSEMKKLTQASRWQSQTPRPGSLTGHLVPNHYSTLPLWCLGVLSDTILFQVGNTRKQHRATYALIFFLVTHFSQHCYFSGI